jgi:lysophospholipase L1-like esterase
LRHFSRALRSLQDGTTPNAKLRILAYGSSSTAGDRYTGYLRAYFQHRFGDAGPGFVALVPLWRWHRHQEVDLEAHGRWTITHDLRPKGRADGLYGLLGARATGRYRGTSTTVTLDRDGERAQRWELWALGEPGGGSFEARLDDGPPRRSTTRAETTGPAYLDLSDGLPHSSLRVRVLGDGPVRLFGAVIEREASGVVVDELGIGGSGARRQLRWNESLWADHVGRRDPSLVILAYGGIESMRDEHDPHRFRRELETILERIERAAPDADCLLMTPQDRAHRSSGKNRRRPSSLDSILEVQRSVADARGCALFDAHAVMGGAGSMRQWVAADLARPDHVHFTAAGYAHLGRALVNAIMQAAESPPD